MLYIYTDKPGQRGGFDFPVTVSYVNRYNNYDMYTIPQLVDLAIASNSYISPFSSNYNYNYVSPYVIPTEIDIITPVSPIFTSNYVPAYQAYQSYPVSPSYFLNSPAYNNYFNENSAYGQIRKEYKKLKVKDELYGLTEREKETKKQLKKQLKFL